MRRVFGLRVRFGREAARERAWRDVSGFARATSASVVVAIAVAELNARALCQRARVARLFTE